MKRERVLDLAGAQKIIGVACKTMAHELANNWSDLMNPNTKFIVIEYKEYEEMRKFCSPEQHKVLDEVFGKDEENPIQALINILTENRCISYSLMGKLIETFDIKFKK